jgi:hypothetical protein
MEEMMWRLISCFSLDAMARTLNWRLAPVACMRYRGVLVKGQLPTGILAEHRCCITISLFWFVFNELASGTFVRAMVVFFSLGKRHLKA